MKALKQHLRRPTGGESVDNGYKTTAKKEWTTSYKFEYILNMIQGRKSTVKAHEEDGDIKPEDKQIHAIDQCINLICNKLTAIPRINRQSFSY